MNNLSAYHSVQELLKELQDLIEELKNDQGNTSQLELDLIKEKIRVIYDKLCDVKIIKPIEKQKEVETVVELEDLPGQKKKQTLDVEQEFEEKEQTEIERPVSVEKKESDEQLSPSEPTLNLFEEPLRNKEINDKKSVGEQMAKDKTIESIGDVIQSKKIVNLKLAIGINEKFFFLNELFEGNMKEYNETIEALDQKDTYKDAMEYLVLLQEKKNWDEESEAYIQLKGFLERKFN